MRDRRADLAFPYNIMDVFNAVLQCAPQLKMSVVVADNVNYTIRLSKGMSLTTWGENIVVYLGILPDRRTGVTIISSSKLGTEITAGSQNQKNVQAITNALNAMLPGGMPQAIPGQGQ